MLIRMLKTGGWWCWKSGFPVIGTRGRACGGGEEKGKKGDKKSIKKLSNGGFVVVLRPQIESSYNIGLGVFAGWRGR